jgi:hypothetical protein
MKVSGGIADRLGMKRNMDLIREILLFAEENCDGRKRWLITPRNLSDKYQSIDKSLLMEHVVYAADERGLVVIEYDSIDYTIIRLTSKGRKFLSQPVRNRQWIIEQCWAFVFSKTKKAGDDLITDGFKHIILTCATLAMFALLAIGSLVAAWFLGLFRFFV